MTDPRRVVQGRGAVTNPQNRFERLAYERDPEAELDATSPETVFYRDPTRTILAKNESPDVGFERSINPYRGCEHGCVYCFARPTHEYLGFSAGLDFETKILVKPDAPQLLREELSSPGWVPQVIAISGVTDAYQPVEKRLGITRGCIEVLAEFMNPLFIITKNQLVTRDADLLGTMARHDAAAVFLSVTTLDGDLARVMEPRTSQPTLKLDAIRELTAAGVPTGVMIGPVIPGLTDHEIPSIIAAAKAAGAQYASYVMLRLPWAVAGIFEAWLEEHFPDRKEKVLNRVRSMRDGKLYDPKWGVRQKGEGIFADQVRALFTAAVRRAGIEGKSPRLSAEGFRRAPDRQHRLF